MDITGNCFRCNGLGHLADDESCPWLQKAVTVKEHMARIDSLRMRFVEFQIEPWRKTRYIEHENKLWKAGKS